MIFVVQYALCKSDILNYETVIPAKAGIQPILGKHLFYWIPAPRRNSGASFTAGMTTMVFLADS
jgi:hypothetical protein